MRASPSGRVARALAALQGGRPLSALAIGRAAIAGEDAAVPIPDQRKAIIGLRIVNELMRRGLARRASWNQFAAADPVPANARRIDPQSPEGQEIARRALEGR